MFVDCGNKMINLDKFTGVEIFAESEMEGNKEESPTGYAIIAIGGHYGNNEVMAKNLKPDIAEKLFEELKSSWSMEHIRFNLQKEQQQLEQKASSNNAVVFGHTKDEPEGFCWGR